MVERSSTTCAIGSAHGHRPWRWFRSGCGRVTWGSAAAWERRSRSDMIGEVVKDYRILSFLGEGGMGTVYRAEHRLIGKPAVVKVLRPHLSADQAVVRRFMN